ncbi:hypothetical protein DL98DRAFT_580864 [Cadophora sp. DSE1049]|nr:hypothetical protein DL98DRAFT_580864 [Cadophora sp. DSE1049]
MMQADSKTRISAAPYTSPPSSANHSVQQHHAPQNNEYDAAEEHDTFAPPFTFARHIAIPAAIAHSKVPMIRASSDKRVIQIVNRTETEQEDAIEIEGYGKTISSLYENPEPYLLPDFLSSYYQCRERDFRHTMLTTLDGTNVCERILPGSKVPRFYEGIDSCSPA